MDKREIVERLKNIAGYAVHTVGEEPFVMSLDDGIAVHEAIELLKKLETNCSEIPNNWIPCSERLPEEMQKVLVWFEYYRYGDYNCMYQTYGFGYVYDGKWSSFINGETGWKDARIIAWMPLPEPYKEKEQKQQYADEETAQSGLMSAT